MSIALYIVSVYRNALATRNTQVNLWIY